MYITPIAGRHVPDPERGGIVPEAGRYIEPTQYWLRRIDDGDVIETEPPADQQATDKPHGDQ
jgi:hypothetical protein